MRAALFVLCTLFAVVPFSPVHADTDPVAVRAQLEAQLSALEAQIAKNKDDLSVTQAQRQSFERDVAVLKSKIKDAELSIKARELTIQKIGGDITQKQQGIKTLDQKVQEGRQSVAQMLRYTHMIDETPLVVVALGSSLSDFFQDIDDFAAVERALRGAFSTMAVQRSDLASRQEALLEQQQEQEQLRQIQLLQQRSLQDTQKQKQTLVAAAKGQENLYQKTLKANEKSAAQIRAALFALRDSSKSVNFGDMFSYAKEAGARTGVRPALILGILREESNLGQNVGTGNWKVDMHPTRDVPVFQAICAKLGLNPDTQPVSKKPWYGYGGAMGPAQFIPSTWVLYEDRIASATGQTPPNPWDPRTAVFATALLMADNGADAGGRSAERLAALRYLAGWKNASKASYAFYGDDVMGFADEYQKQIDIIGG